MALASSWKPGGRLSDGPPNIFSNEDTFHDSSFPGPCFETKQGHRLLPFQRLSMSLRFVPTQRQAVSAQSKDRHLTFPRG